MPHRFRSAASLFGLFLVSVMALWTVSWFSAVLHPDQAGYLVGALVSGSIALGVLWIAVGWVFAPSVETYLGQGAFEGFPIIGPSWANPARTPPVMDDLARKLSRETDVGLGVAALGFVLMSLGFVTYLAPTVGVVAIAAFTVVLAGVTLKAAWSRPAGRAA